MPANYDKLKGLLRELFQMDQADLDFGIFRIMNAKRDEIERFLEHDLLPQVQKELARHIRADGDAKRVELEEAIEKAKAIGVDPDMVPRVLELREQVKQGADLAALENEVFSHLYNFFRRYYDQGDFLSLRRYKEGVYAIPYEGEEVKLYWANHDQYYIKSSEYLRNYTFKVADGRRVHFKVVEADAEAHNNKPQAGKERRFILAESEPVVVTEDGLTIRFEYRVVDRKQSELNAEAVASLLGNSVLVEWITALAEARPTEKNKERTLLEKHLSDFTAKNTFDYFIHKDLGGFLRRELDFIIKNEIMHLDDVEDDAAPKVELYLSKIKALRKIAHKIIAFLEQLETFQKKLWLKKKFVVETNYCVTLDRVPEELYPQIMENKAQVNQWKRLFAIKEIERSTVNPGFVEPITNDFLKANSTLLVDTAFFRDDFRTALLASSSVLKGKPDLDAALDGLLVQSENYQGLLLLHRRYAEKVKCAYFDPPYNTGLDGFPYKDSYQHSSWLAMFRDRLALARLFLTRNGLALVSVDENEVSRLRVLAEQVFGEDNFLTDLIWQGSSKNDQKYFSICHEYIAVLLKDKEFLDDSPERWVERKEGLDEIYAAFAKIQALFPDDFKQQEAALKEWYSGLRPSNPAKSQAHYNRVEKRGIYFPDNISKPAKGYYYDVFHPVTKQPCVKPKGGWRFVEETMKEELAADNIHFGPDHTTVPCRKSFLKETEFMSPRTVIYQDGRAATGLLRDILGGKDYFPNPKDKDVLARLFRVSTDETAIILDGFAGSGTTAQSVIELNREGNGHRKYVLLEMADYFDTVLRPRIERIIYSREWKDGMPVGRDGGSHFFKYIRLETYEDCLNNLELKRTTAQQDLLTQKKDFREDYVLRYMLDVETQGSASLLNVQKFTDPFSYKLKVSTGTVGETKEVNVDLVETFNWLIGLKVKHLDHIRNVRVVEGTNPQGDRVLILWRNVAEVSSDKLDEWLQKEKYNTRDNEYDLIYVNGDNNLENLRREDETWKVRLIEEDFQKLMWECQDV